MFKHESHLGNARAGELFERIEIKKKNGLPRSYGDYEVAIRRNDLPKGVAIEEKL